MSFGIFKTIFLVPNVNIRHFSKNRQICRASWIISRNPDWHSPRQAKFLVGEGVGLHRIYTIFIRVLKNTTHNLLHRFCKTDRQILQRANYVCNLCCAHPIPIFIFRWVSITAVFLFPATPFLLCGLFFITF